MMLEHELKKHFGFDAFLKGQKEVVEKVMSGQSAAAIFPTGAGKSLCYQLPAVLLPHLTLVVSPLLALMKNQLEFLQTRGIHAARLDSTVDRKVHREIMKQAQNGCLKILMISVERFKNEHFRNHLRTLAVSLLVVDEAHCISEWGHNFRPEYLKLPVYQQEFSIQQTLLLTATATQAVADDMCRKLQVPKNNVVQTGFYRDNLFLQVTPVAEAEKKKYLLDRICQDPSAPTIVYVTLQKTAEEVAALLIRHEVKAAAYHAGMKNEEREEVQNRFMSGTLSCVAATIAFGMGIDKDNIRRVIHFDLPKSLENYSQEVGRSGRDGCVAFCEVLANRDTITILENFAYGDTPDRSSIQGVVADIRNHAGSVWEVKLIALSAAFNIRLLPLKTLLAYLEMERIIRSRGVYFEEYAFRYLLDPEIIRSRFDGERKQFVSTILDHCHSRKTWTSVDIEGILASYTTDRKRIVAALQYFDENEWIELQARQSVDRYDVVNDHFDIRTITEKMHRLFSQKEAYEIGRIHTMVALLEGDGCISRNLAGYFGEDIGKQQCGHCSRCGSGSGRIERTIDVPPLASLDYEALTARLRATVQEGLSADSEAKFLCGISMPAFARLRVNRLSNFGSLQYYPFKEVREWVSRQVPG